MGDGVWGGGLCSSSPSKGLEYAKNISPAANQRETGGRSRDVCCCQALLASTSSTMMHWGKGPGHVWALWSIWLQSLWNAAWLKHQRVLYPLIWLRKRNGIFCWEEDFQTIGLSGGSLSGINWRTGWKSVTVHSHNHLIGRSDPEVSVSAGEA